MADLGNLWFSLGLDDSKFDKEWKAAFEKYKKDAKIDVLINIDKNQLKSINDVTDALSKVNGIAGKKKAKIDIEVTQRTLDGIKALRDMGITSAQLQGIKNAAKAAEEYAKHLQRAQNISNTGHKTIIKNFNEQSLWLQNLRSLAGNYLSLYAIKNFAIEVANVTGEFEKQRVTLQAMVGEMEGLDIYNKMKALSVESPFEFKDLASYAKQLAAFSVPYDELYETTKKLADVSAGLGVDMSRIILAYGQIKSAGVLKGTELRQLTEAGVPILEKLQKKFEQLRGTSVSVGEIFENISKKMVSFEMVKEVFDELTSAGGKFYNMQQIQAETLAGKISNLKDAYAIMLTEIGEGSNTALSKGIDLLYSLMDNWEKVGLAIKSVVTGFGMYQAAQIAAFSASKLNLINLFGAAMIRFSGSVNKAVRAVTMLNAVSKAGAWGAIIGILSSIVVALGGAYMAAKRFNNELQSMINSQVLDFQNEVEALRNLTKAIEQTTEGTESRKRAIDDYNSRFGQYLKNLYDEKTALNAIVEGNKNVTKAISDRYKEEAILRAKQAVEDKYGKEKSEVESNFIKLMREKGLGAYSGSAVAIVKEVLESNNEATMDDIQRAFNRIFNDKVIANNIGYRFKDFFDDYKTSFLTYIREMKNSLQDVDNAFNTSIYDSYKIGQEYDRITKEYQKNLKGIRDTNKPGSKELQNAEREAEKTYLKELIKLYAHNTNKVAEYEARLKKLTNTEKTWREDVKELFQGKNIPEIYTPKIDETFSEFIERIREDYKKAKKTLKDLQQEDFSKEAPALKARVSLYDELAKKWGISLDEKADNAAAQKELKEQREAVAKLKTQYDSLLAVYKAYINLKKKTGDEGIATRAVAEEFSDYKNDLLAALEKDGGIEDYMQQMFASLGELALANGGEFGERFVEGMKSTLGTLDIKEVVDAINISQQLFEKMKKWGMENFMLQGQGVSLDMSKVLQEQNEANNRAIAKTQEVEDMINKISKAGDAERAAAKEVIIQDLAEKEMMSEEQIAELRKKSLDDILSYALENANALAQTEMDNNHKIAQDKINELGKAYAKQQAEDALAPGAMENLANKSYGELKALQEELNRLMSEDPKISDKTKEKLEEEQITLEEFIKNYKDYLQLLGKKVSNSRDKQVKDDLLAAGDAAVEIVESLKQLSDTNFMSGFLDALGLGVGVAKEITQAFKKKEDGTGFELANVTSLIGAVSMVATSVINGISAAKQYRQEMERAGQAFKNSVLESAYESMVLGEKFETIFGDNVVGALEKDSEAIQLMSSELRNASRSVANMKIKTKKGFWGIGAQYTSLSDLAPQLFNQDGTVNYKYLDEFLDAYGDKISESQKALLEHLKATYDQYENAMKDVNDYLSGIFSDTASTIADRMLEAFAATGNAATELGDMVNGIANQMAKDLIQSLLIDQYLAPTIERVKNLYNPQHEEYEEDAVVRTQKSILALRDGLAAAEGGAAEVNKILQGLADYGIDFAADADKSSEVLSGLTEAQQNLLMGYINGIRADVSVNKGMMSDIVNSVGTINNNVADAIIVWKQIEANTHRSADGVDRIIGFFENIMGPYDGGGGQAIKVNIA